MNDTVGRIVGISETHFSRADERELPPVQPQQATPMSMLAIAVQRGMDPATLRDLMALQERWEANEARKAFAVAVAEFKAARIAVYKDKENTQYSSLDKKAMYTSKGNLVNTVNPELSKHGLSARWTFDQTNGIKVTCTLTHKMGHSESVFLSGLPDESGKKNPLQQIKSTITYLEIATFEAVTGTASAEDSVDDDGNASGGKQGISEIQIADWEAELATCATAEEVLALGKVITAECSAIEDLDTYNKFKPLVQARKREILKGTK